MEQMYNVSSNPHIRDKMTTSRIMQLVVIALLPTTLFGIWNFGVHDKSRVTILDDICATAKGYESLAYMSLKRRG